MRLSADPASPFYDGALIPDARVLLNGVEIVNCVEASEEEGWAIVLKQDEAGDVIMDGDSAETLRIAGRVEIRLPEATS